MFMLKILFLVSLVSMIGLVGVLLVVASDTPMRHKQLRLVFTITGISAIVLFIVLFVGGAF